MIYTIRAMEIKDWVKAARKHKDWNQTQLGDVVGRTKGNIGHWETGKHTPSIEQIAAISVATGYPMPLMGAQASKAEPSNVEAAPQMRQRKGIPVVGEVKGGDDGYLDELQYPVGHGEGTVDYPTADPNAYALRVRGDSMHPRYRAGEFIVVEPSIEAQPGDDVVVALRDGRKLLKELNWRRDGEAQLLSVNNHFGPLTLQESEIQSVQLVAGRVRRSAMNKTPNR